MKRRKGFKHWWKRKGQPASRIFVVKWIAELAWRNGYAAALRRQRRKP